MSWRSREERSRRKKSANASTLRGHEQIIIVCGGLTNGKHTYYRRQRLHRLPHDTANGIPRPSSSPDRCRAALTGFVAAGNQSAESHHERHRRRNIPRTMRKRKADAYLSCCSSSARRIAHGIKLLLPCNDEYSRSSQGIKNSTGGLLQLRIDLRPAEKTRRRFGERRRRGNDLSHLLLPRRENCFRMDGRLLQGERRRRFCPAQIFLSLWPLSLSKHPARIEEGHSWPTVPALSYPPA